MPEFIFGGDTGETPESLRRKRQIARLMLRQGGSGRARTLGEGLASFGQSIGGGLINRSINQRESEIETDSRRRVTQALSAIGGVQAFENPDDPSETLVPAVPGDTNRGIGILSGAIDPDVRNIAFQLQQRQMDTEAERNKPFNLSPGQQRFGAPDASGERPVIASVPPTPSTPTAIKNVVFRDGTTRAFRADDPRLDQAIEQGATVIGQQVQAATPGDLTNNRADELRGEIGAISGARRIVGDIRQQINENRSRGGAVGTIKGMVQTGTGIALDIAEAMNIEGSGALFTTLQEVNRDIQQGAADAEISRLFDPSIPQNKVRENALAYALARARKGPGRLNSDDVNNARQDVKITGATSVDDVLARLSAIEEELGGAQSGLEGRLGGETSGGVPVFEVQNGRLVPVQ